MVGVPVRGRRTEEREAEMRDSDVSEEALLPGHCCRHKEEQSKGIAQTSHPPSQEAPE